MNTLADKLTLHFFRATPPDMLKNPPLASSLQSLETTFFLLSLGRYPSALVSCVSAWESAIKAKLKISPDDDRVPIAKLLGTIRELSAGLKQFDRADLDNLRQTRNRIVHYGFSPHDDQECGRFLLETGLLFLTALYRELFAFHLNWRDARTGVTDFMQLTQQEAARIGLVPYFSDQIHIVNSMYELNRDREDFDVLFCFTAFAHFLRLKMKELYASSADTMVAERAASIGFRYEAENDQKRNITEQLGGVTFEFDCPMCNASRSVVSGLNEDALSKGHVDLSWGICVSCKLEMPRAAYHLANLVLQRELSEQSSAILESFG
jgi:hypothetical protein